MTPTHRPYRDTWRERCAFRPTEKLPGHVVLVRGKFVPVEREERR